MISYEEALSQVLGSIQPVAKSRVRLEQLDGLVLGEPLIATIDLPPFDNSAVDGYGVCLADVLGAGNDCPVELQLAGEIRAGDAISERIPSGSAFRIFTGAQVPEGVDAVVMQEHCSESGSKVSIARCPKPGENIRRRGEEFLRGQEILPSGLRITPPVVGLMASLGQASFMVCKRPTVAVVTTGNELVKPGKHLSSGQIYDSNSYALSAAVRAAGVEECHPFHCPEDLEQTRKVLTLALSVSDILITVGGVSVGAHDYVKQALEELGVKTVVYKVAIKPGKPFYFGTFTRKKKRKLQYVFGLPGNPVSALVTFHELVRPALDKLAGATIDTAHPLTGLFARLTQDLRKSAGRVEFVRGNLGVNGESFTVEPTTGQDSHMLGGLSKANCLIEFPQDCEVLKAGSMVRVRLLDWRV